MKHNVKPKLCFCNNTYMNSKDPDITKEENLGLLAHTEHSNYLRSATLWLNEGTRVNNLQIDFWQMNWLKQMEGLILLRLKYIYLFDNKEKLKLTLGQVRRSKIKVRYAKSWKSQLW